MQAVLRHPNSPEASRSASFFLPRLFRFIRSVGTAPLLVVTMTMITPPVSSLYKAPSCPEGQSVPVCVRPVLKGW